MNIQANWVLESRPTHGQIKKIILKNDFLFSCLKYFYELLRKKIKLSELNTPVPFSEAINKC